MRNWSHEKYFEMINYLQQQQKNCVLQFLISILKKCAL